MARLIASLSEFETDIMERFVQLSFETLSRQYLT